MSENTEQACPVCCGTGTADGALGFRGLGPCPKCRPETWNRPTNPETFDDVAEAKQTFLQRCKNLPPGESFTLSWAHFQRVAPIPNLTGCSVSEYGRDDIRIFKPRH